MRLVMKFGGTSIGDAERIKNVSEIVAKEYKNGSEIAVVVSALPGVTDSLIEIANKIITTNGEGGKNLEAFINKILKKHTETITGVVKNNKCREDIIKKMDENLEKLRNALQYIKNSKELTPPSNDYILSFGEKLSAPIISGAIIEQGIDSVSLTGDEVGLITNSDYGNAEPIMPLTRKNVLRTILPLFKQGIVPVITGFIGKDGKGIQTTLGRGGSDYTASIIGASLSADEIIIWKDVEGFMTADPKIVPNARLINTLSYDEAIELASYGAKILHPRAIEPLIEEEIKMHIKYTFNPAHPGTFVHMPDPIVRSPISGIATLKDIVLLRIGGARTMGLENIAVKIFKVLAEERVSVKMLAQATSEPIISLVIDKHNLKGVLKALKQELGEKREMKIIPEDGYSVITVVGEGMRGKYGIAGAIFSALGDEEISIAMIAQSSFELNISFVVERKVMEKAVQLVHKKFNLDKSPWALEYEYKE